MEIKQYTIKSYANYVSSKIKIESKPMVQIKRLQAVTLENVIQELTQIYNLGQMWLYYLYQKILEREERGRRWKERKRRKEREKGYELKKSEKEREWVASEDRRRREGR